MKPRVARIWQGRTRAAIANEYAGYLYEHGVKQIRATKGNLGVEVLREKDKDYLLELPTAVRHFDILIDEP